MAQNASTMLSFCTTAREEPATLSRGHKPGLPYNRGGSCATAKPHLLAKFLLLKRFVGDGQLRLRGANDSNGPQEHIVDEVLLQAELRL